MNNTLLRLIAIAGAAFVTSAAADPIGQCGEGNGWAHMWQNAHQMRMETRVEGDTKFLYLSTEVAGPHSMTEFLTSETPALEAALLSGQQVERLAARLIPEEGFLGGGWARYTVFDEDTQVSRVLSINMRLRLIKQDGSLANPELGLTETNAGAAVVRAHFQPADATADYATCTLAFEGIVYDPVDTSVADYATYGLTVKEFQNGDIVVFNDDGTVANDGTGCADMDNQPILPAITPSSDGDEGDVVAIGVTPPPTDDIPVPLEVERVLVGGF